MFDDSNTLTVLVTGLTLAGLTAWWLLTPAKAVAQAPPMTDETKKDPLASLRPAPSTPQADGEVPDAVRAALMEIVAEALRNGTPLKFWDVPNVMYQGFPMGSYRITIEKTA